MFGLSEALMSFIRRQVGLRDDAASSTGSLHAKVTNIQNNVDTIGDSTDVRTDNTVMGRLNTSIKSWQQINFVPDSRPYSIYITSVIPSKCLVFLNGSGASGDTTGSIISCPYYITGFTTNQLTINWDLLGWTHKVSGTGSLVIVEFY